MTDEPRSKGLLHVAKKAKAIAALHDYSGIVTWEGNDRFCMYNSLGVLQGCWTLQSLIVNGLIEDTTVSDKTEAERVLSVITKRLSDIHEDRKRDQDQSIEM